MTLQADIECFERGQVGQERTAHSTRAHQGEIIASRKSKKKQFKSPELTRDQLVPFLAKGIEELREKLNMKKL
jgi:DNA-binding transcriptional regulator YiaG